MTVLEFGNVRQEVTEREGAAIKSELTGRNLRQFAVEFTVSSSEASALRESLGDAKEIVLVLCDERMPCERGTWNTSEAQGSGLADFHIELTEQETVEPGAVSLGSMRLVPARYDEQYTFGGDRHILMTVLLAPGEDRALRGLLRDSETVQVVRHGISDAPLELRPGAMLHSVESDGRRKIRFALVEPKDGRPPLALWHATEVKVARELAAERRRSRLLLELLVAKGVLTEDDAEKVGRSDEAEVDDFLYSLSEVEDADDRWL